jgi:hypothetical protein
MVPEVRGDGQSPGRDPAAERSEDRGGAWIKGNHLPLKALHDKKGLPMSAKVVLAMCEFKFKGLIYYLKQTIAFAMRLETEAVIRIENTLLIGPALRNNTFLLATLSQMDGVDAATQVNQSFPTRNFTRRRKCPN